MAKKHHILFAEDNDLIAAAKSAELEAWGFLVHRVSHAEGVAEAIRDRVWPIDLLLVAAGIGNELALDAELTSTVAGAEIPVVLMLSGAGSGSVKHVCELMPSSVIASDTPIEVASRALEAVLQAREEVREVESQRRRLREVGSHAKLGVWEYDPQSACFDLSYAAREVLELPSDTGTSLDTVTKLYADSSERLTRALALAVESGKAFIVDAEIVTPTGKRKWLRTQGQADPDGSGTSVFGTVQDISDIRLQDRIKQDAELTLSQVEEITHIGHWSVNLVDGSFYHSDEIKRIFGYEPSEYALSVEDAIEAYHPDDREEVIRLFNRAAETGEGYEFDLRIVQPSGAFRYVHSKGYTEKDEGGKVVRVYGVFQDITDQVLSEAALRESEASMKALVDGVHTAIVVHDKRGEIVLSNQLANHILEPLAEHVVGLGLDDFAWRFVYEDGTQVPASELPVSRILRTRRPVENLIIGFHSTRSDATTWVLTSGIPVMDSDGDLSKVIVSFADITSLKAMEEQLHQAEKMKAIGQLAGGVAHDFNNQLAGMLSYAELALEELDESATAFSYISGVISGISRAADLTKKLLAFARKGKYVVQAVNMNDLIDEVASMVRHSFDKRIRVTLSADARPTTVAGDRSQLHNAILNMALNSRDAMPDGGELVITSKRVTLDEDTLGSHAHVLQPGEHVKITVSDTGTGMDAETQRRIFEPFFTTKAQGQGTGMGMASVYGTVQSHHGAIDVTSAPGQGTTITLTFPSHGPAELESESLASKAETHSGRILVVDDEEMIARAMKLLLAKKGYQATTCANGREALEIFTTSWETIDLVILDMNMPEMNGEETFHAMKKVNPQVKVLLLSGYSLTNETRSLVEEGAVGFLSKPVLSKNLFAAVSNALGMVSTRPLGSTKHRG